MSRPTAEQLRQAVEKMILSASGWRKIFAADGDEESRTQEIGEADRWIVAAAALVFAEYQIAQTGKENPLIYIGCDTRPTGAALMDIMSRIFIAMGIRIKPVFIAAAPEIMAAVKLDDEADGFVYISASHNPIGHNGLKFGGRDGAVYGGTESAKLIENFQAVIDQEKQIEGLAALSASVSPQQYDAVLSLWSENKKESLQSYRRFTRRVVSGMDAIADQEKVLSSLSEAIAKNPIGIVGELNGSARGLSIDEDFMTAQGLSLELHNRKPGEIVHRIVPEGGSLDLCRELLEKAHRENPAFILGYVPDNDGDRGNLVYFSERDQRAHPIAAQVVFALTVLSELAYLSFLEKNAPRKKRTAVVVNGPTSMMVEGIAAVFDAEVYRAEVGEANVVRLAEQLRRQGYLVRILGEGSNGGNITHPATVRDPLNTLFSIVRLLVSRGDTDGFSPFQSWCELSGRSGLYRPDFSLEEVIDSLPAFTTTSAYEPEALMKIQSRNHAVLKSNYEKLFIEEWEERKSELEQKFGIASWRELNYEGSEAKEGFGERYRSGKAKGGLKIIFSDKDGRDTDFMWMRGSGTEPVFRVLVDSLGRSRQRQDELLNWHRSMIERADKSE